MQLEGRETAGGDLYYSRPEYVEQYSISSERAEQMVKVFKRIERGIEKLRQEWGEPQDFAQYVLFYGKALGISRMAWESEHGYIGWGSATRGYMLRPLADGAADIRDTSWKWQREQAKSVQEVAS